MESVSAARGVIQRILPVIVEAGRNYFHGQELLKMPFAGGDWPVSEQASRLAVVAAML